MVFHEIALSQVSENKSRNLIIEKNNVILNLLTTTLITTALWKTYLYYQCFFNHLVFIKLWITILLSTVTYPLFIVQGMKNKLIGSMLGLLISGTW